MITLHQALDDIVKQSPFLEEGLSSGIINLSGLARRLKPLMEKRLYKKPTQAAMVMALKRITPRAKIKPRAINEFKHVINLTVRSNLTEYVFNNFAELISLQKQLLQLVQSKKDLFVSLSQGVSETTLIVSSGLETKVEKLVPKAVLIDKITDLTSITVRLRPEHVYTPGVYYALLKSLAWENINLIEALSGYSEISVVVKQKDSDRAFGVIQSLSSK